MGRHDVLGKYSRAARRELPVRLSGEFSMALAERCGALGLRISAKGEAVLRALDIASEPVSAKELHRSIIAMDPSVSLSITYWTLAILERNGLVRSLRVPRDGSRADVDASGMQDLRWIVIETRRPSVAGL